jgi:hypothetical protein
MDFDCGDIYSMHPSGKPGGTLSLECLEPGDRTFESWHGAQAHGRPVRLAVRERRKVGDVVTAGDIGEYLVSPRMLDVLTDEGLTGWSTYPVEVTGPTAEQLDGYLGLWITGRSGPIDDRLTERVILPPSVPGAPSMPHYKGFCPAAGSWDGSDFFVPEDTRYTCVTSRVRDVLVSHRMVGVSFARMSEITLLVWDE